MAINVTKTDLKTILPLRNLFLQENNFQIRYNACHERGWTDSYTINHNDKIIGYGSVKGNENISDRDTIFEFYIIPVFRKKASEAFSALISTSKPTFIECQSNDVLLTNLLFQFGQNINSDVILFGEGYSTNLSVENTIFRKRKSEDVIFEHRSEPIGDYVLGLNNEIVATGGFLTHYNHPFVDLYMEVREDCRRKGFGGLLIQEIRKECYLLGKIPAARCNIKNEASRATLLKGGFKIAGFMLLGELRGI